MPHIVGLKLVSPVIRFMDFNWHSAMVSPQEERKNGNY